MFGEIMFNTSTQAIEFQREAKILKDHLGDTMQAIADFDGVIAGGAITSVFTRKEINDIDIYFPDAKKASQFVAALYSKEFGYHNFTNVTNKSLMFVSRDSEAKCQLIFYKFHLDVQSIFNDFDFTINMGAYIPKEDKFILHEDFLKHNSQRTIQINTNTAYPIISVLRIQKYADRGYHVSKPQLVRLLLRLSQLGINSWKELKDHLGGMYGYNVDDIFPEDKEFSMELAISVLDSISPKIMTAVLSQQLSLTDIQEKTVDVFPEGFGKIKDYWRLSEGEVSPEDYAYPDDAKNTTPKAKPTDLDFPF